MPFSVKEFLDAYAREQGDVAARVITVLEQSQEALTAEDIAGILVGSTGRYAQALDPKLQEILPAVEEVLGVYAKQDQVRKATLKTRLGAPQVAYFLTSRMPAKA